MREKKIPKYFEFPCSQRSSALEISVHQFQFQELHALLLMSSWAQTLTFSPFQMATQSGFTSRLQEGNKLALVGDQPYNLLHLESIYFSRHSSICFTRNSLDLLNDYYNISCKRQFSGCLSSTTTTSCPWSSKRGHHFGTTLLPAFGHRQSTVEYKT